MSGGRGDCVRRIGGGSFGPQAFARDTHRVVGIDVSLSSVWPQDESDARVPIAVRIKRVLSSEIRRAALMVIRCFWSVDSV